MQIVRKILFGMIFVVLCMPLLVERTHAEQADGVKLSVHQVFNLAEHNSSVNYTFELENDGEDFIDEFKFVPGISESQGRNEISIDFKDDPIAPGQNRTFSVELISPNLVEDYGDFKKVLIPEFKTKVYLGDFNTQIIHPDDWGAPTYSSLINAKNSQAYLFWGNSVALGFSLDFEFVSSIEGGDFAYPLLVRDVNQQIHFDSYSGVKGTVRDESGSYLLLDNSKQIKIQGMVVLEGLENNKTDMDNSQVAKINQIIEKLKKDYNVNTQKERLNLCVKFAKELNDSGYKSEAFLGFDLQQFPTISPELSCWVESQGSDDRTVLDPFMLIAQGNQVVRSINTDRIKILNLSLLPSDNKLLELNFPKYNFTYLREISTDMPTYKVEISVLPIGESCKESIIPISVYNPTKQIVWLNAPEEIDRGVLPGQRIDFGLNKKELRKNENKIIYLLGSQEIAKELAVETENCSISFGITQQGKSIVLLALIIFLVMVMISKITSRPHTRFSL